MSQYLFYDIANELQNAHFLQREKFKNLPDEEFQKEMTARKVLIDFNDFLKDLALVQTNKEDWVRNDKVTKLIDCVSKVRK